MKRILVIYGAGAGFVPTTHHYVDALRRHSRFQVEYLCIEHVPKEVVDLACYDAIWVNYCARLIVETHYLDAVPEALKESLARYNGPKLVAVQDEYDHTNRLHHELLRIGANVVLTCVPQASADYVYPRAIFPELRFETVLTGYVSDDLLRISGVRPLAERPVVVGYRGRELGFRYGDLADQKSAIGRHVREACLSKGIPCDIAIDESSRIYGAAWFDFIKSCRVMLGSESGSNVFDFDGSIAKLQDDMFAADPDLSYERFRPFITARQKEIDMGQISPRMFEAAAMRTAMVLLRGRYSGVLVPDRHYLALELDYSNLEEVLERVQDLPRMQAMADRTYQDLIASGKYSYRAFVKRTDDILAEVMRQRVPTPDLSRSAPDIGIITDRPLGHDPYLLAETSRLRAQFRILGEQLDQRTVQLSSAYRDVDRLLGEVRMYGDTITRILEENERLRRTPTGWIIRALGWAGRNLRGARARSSRLLKNDFEGCQ